MATLRSLSGLNDSQFSRLLKEKGSKKVTQVKKVRSLLTIIEHYLISWETEDCCLLVKNLLDVDHSRADQKTNGNKPQADRVLVKKFPILMR